MLQSRREHRKAWRDRGFSTSETLVAMALTVLIIAFAANAAVTSMKSQRESQLNNAANELTRSTVESARSTRWDRLGMSAAVAAATPRMPISSSAEPGYTVTSADPAIPSTQTVRTANFDFLVTVTVAWRSSPALRGDTFYSFNGWYSSPQASKYVGVTVSEAGNPGHVFASQFVAISPPLMESVRYFNTKVTSTSVAYSNAVWRSPGNQVMQNEPGALTGSYARSGSVNTNICLTKWEYTTTGSWADYRTIQVSSPSIIVPGVGCAAGIDLLPAGTQSPLFGTFAKARGAVDLDGPSTKGKYVGKETVWFPFKPWIQYGPNFIDPNTEIAWPNMPGARKVTLRIGSIGANGTLTNVVSTVDVTVSRRPGFANQSGYAFTSKPAKGAAVTLTVESSQPDPVNGGYLTFSTVPFELNWGQL